MTYITELHEQNYHTFTQKGLALVDVFANWCGPCKQLSPIVDKLSVDFHGDLLVGKLDADKNQTIIEELGVRSIPAIFLFKDGKLVEKLTGMQSHASLSILVKKHLVD